MSAYAFPFTEIEYPDSDGLPMAESDFQREVLIYAVEALRIHFRDRDDVYISGNLFVYYEEGNPRAVVAPDVFVVIGASNHDRPSYKLWNEPKGPDFVLEITSKSTRGEDQGAKRGIYAYLGVREYWQYDPTRDYLDPPLQGFQLIERNYWPLRATAPVPGGFSLHSEVLGLDLRLEEGVLRFHDPRTGNKLISHQEAEQARLKAEQARLEAEANAARELALRQAAEARLAELEARLRGLDPRAGGH
jgi:Uma2 family endonuclease